MEGTKQILKTTSWSEASTTRIPGVKMMPGGSSSKESLGLNGD